MAKNYKIEIDEKEIMDIVINGKKISSTSKLTFSDYCMAFEIIDKEDDFKKAFLYIVNSKFRDNLTPDEVNKLSDKQCSEIMDILFVDDEHKKIFQDLHDDNIYKGYFISLNKQAQQIIAKAVEPFKKDFVDLTSKIMNDFAVSFSNKLFNSIKQMTTSINEFTKQVFKFDFDSHTLKVWAEYGWTTIGHAPITLFLKKPVSQEQANSICLEFFGENEMPAFLEKVSQINYANDYIKESIELFNLEYYRGCAMLVISAIDRILSENIISYTKNSKERLIGNQAIIKIKEDFNQSNGDLLRFTLVINNLVSYLGILFKRGNSFWQPVDYVNKNYLFHGWLEKEVTRTDCIKLYNALLELNDNIDYIVEICYPQP